jgi:transcription elongation factor GreB
MSRAFVKESDDDASADDLPERPVPVHANYVTARGLAQLEERERDLAARHEALKPLAADDSAAKQKLREVERDLRYLRAQLERAQLVPIESGTVKEIADVRFGATVVIEDEAGNQHQYRIVGDDEADAAAGDISWASPLARSLLGARVGDVVIWRRPAGAVEIEVAGIRYDQA